MTRTNIITALVAIILLTAAYNVIAMPACDAVNQAQSIFKSNGELSNLTELCLTELKEESSKISELIAEQQQRSTELTATILKAKADIAELQGEVHILTSL